MHLTGILTLIAVVIVETAAVSLLTGSNVHNSTKQDLVGVNGQSEDVFRQLLNQETIIRMNLVQNVHTLMKDMLTLNQNLAVAEQKISVLKTEVEELKTENQVLKKESTVQRRHLAEMQRNIKQNSENHEEFRRNIDVDRKTFEMNVSHTLAGIKVEVLNLSITLLDLNTNTRQIESDIPDMIDQKILVMFESINSSLENFNARLMDTGNRFSAQVSNLKNSHSGILSTVTSYVNITVDSLKAELKNSQIEQLKLSSAVTSLEIFRTNVTNNKGDPKKTVAFTAGVTSSSSTWNSGSLVFPAVINNIGDGYNPSTGIFTAPTDGHYVFFVTVVEYTKQHSMVDIVLNGLSKVRTLGDTAASWQTGANMAVLRLQQGDTVWIRHVSGKGYATNSVPITTFSGFLL